MRIAVACDDSERVARHFGRAPYYVVFTVEDGQVVGREVRPKAYHQAHTHAARRGESHGHDHTHPGGHAGPDHHGAMLETIADCQVVLARGMGQGAYESLRAAGIRPALVQAERAEDAVSDYLAARIVNRQLCGH